jgi:hypothetical protein
MEMPNKMEKTNFLIELVNVIRGSQYAILIAGDFNITRKESEKNKPGEYNRWCPLFNVVIEQGGLMEIALTGRKFTWCNNHEKPTYELLGRVLISPSWEEKSTLMCASTLPSVLSNHTPILIKSRDKPRIPPIFRFENRWFMRTDLKDVVSGVWNKIYFEERKIDRCQKKI